MKKVLTSVIVVALLLSVVCGCVACTFGTPEENVIKCANKLKDMVNDPTFEIAGDCGYKKGYEDEDGDYYLNAFIAIQYKVTDESGKEIFDVAYFVDNSFIGYDSDWDNKTYEKWSDSKQIKFFNSILVYLDGVYDDVFKKDEINAALGIGTSSDETVSGTAE